MEEKLIALGSITYALKAGELLYSYGIKSYIERNKSLKGCGYALRIKGDHLKAETVLKEHGFKIYS